VRVNHRRSVVQAGNATQHALPRGADDPAAQIMLARRPGAGALCEPVDLCSDDEVVAGQALDGVGPERDEDLPPGHGQLRVMEFPFGEQRDPGGESEGISEVAQGEFPAEPTDPVSLPALIQLSVQRLGFVLAQRRGAFRLLDGMLLMQRPCLGHRSLLGDWRSCPNPDHVPRRWDNSGGRPAQRHGHKRSLNSPVKRYTIRWRGRDSARRKARAARCIQGGRASRRQESASPPEGRTWSGVRHRFPAESDWTGASPASVAVRHS